MVGRSHLYGHVMYSMHHLNDQDMVDVETKIRIEITVRGKCFTYRKI